MYSTMTPRQFRRRFRTERDCLRYVTRRKWPDGFRCPRCDHDQAYLIESRRLYQCKECGHQTSVTANTIFHKTRKPLRDWFWAIFVVATRTTGSSARQLQYDLGLSYPTAWTWCHKIRKAMEDRDTRYSLRGVVELDDTYFPLSRRAVSSQAPSMPIPSFIPTACICIVLWPSSTTCVKPRSRTATSQTRFSRMSIG